MKVDVSTVAIRNVWEHFAHGADIGVRGIGPTKEAAFEQIALALTGVDGQTKRLFVHRKGATRALGAGHPDLPAVFGSIGQPVLIGGTMGTASNVLA